MGARVTTYYRSSIQDWNEDDSNKSRMATLQSFSQITKAFNSMTLEAFCAYYYDMDLALAEEDIQHVKYLRQCFIEPHNHETSVVELNIDDEMKKKKKLFKKDFNLIGNTLREINPLTFLMFRHDIRPLCLNKNEEAQLIALYRYFRDVHPPKYLLDEKSTQKLVSILQLDKEDSMDQEEGNMTKKDGDWYDPIILSLNAHCD